MIRMVSGLDERSPGRRHRSERSARQLGLDLPLLSERDAKTILTKRFGGSRATTQGVVCECCQYQCSMREMTEYCNSQSAAAGVQSIAPLKKRRSSPAASASAAAGRGVASPKDAAVQWLRAPTVVGTANDAINANNAVVDAAPRRHRHNHNRLPNAKNAATAAAAGAPEHLDAARQGDAHPDAVPRRHPATNDDLDLDISSGGDDTVHHASPQHQLTRVSVSGGNDNDHSRVKEVAGEDVEDEFTAGEGELKEKLIQPGVVQGIKKWFSALASPGSMFRYRQEIGRKQ